MAGCGYADGRHDYQDKLDTVQTRAAIVVGKEAKGELAEDGAEQGEDVDDEARPLAAVGPVDEGDGC